MKKLLLLTAVLILNFEFEISNCSAQAPAIKWQKTFGGTSGEGALSIQQTKDGGYIVAGFSYSVNGEVTGHHGDTTTSDAWVVKLDSNANIQWEKSYGGTGEDYANTIELTKDGGYIMAGITNSNDGDVSGNHGATDYWVVKLDANGTIQWQKCLGGSSDETAEAIEQTVDNGYIVAGYTGSTDGQVTGHHAQYYGFEDYWVVKLSSSGALQWEKCFGGEALDRAYSVHQLKDGGYIVGGSTESNEGDVTGSHDTIYAGYLTPDVWVVKLSSVGNLLWEKCYGGYDVDEGYCLNPTSDGGFIIGSYTGSSNGDVTGYKYAGDYWAVKTDSTGVIEWERCFGGTGTDFASYIQQTKDGGYIMSGSTTSKDGDVTGLHGTYDMWVIKISGGGDLQWEKCLGGSDNEGAPWVLQANDGGYVVAGNTSSHDGDVTINHGAEDFWIVKLEPDGTSSENELEVGGLTMDVFPNPSDGIFQITDSKSKIEKIEVYNLLGELVLDTSIKTQDARLDLTFQPKGIYFYRAYCNDGVLKEGKLIIQ